MNSDEDEIRVLTNEDMDGLLDVREVIEPMETAYQELGHGVAPDHPRHRVYIPEEFDEGDEIYFFNNIMGAFPGRDVMALRIDSTKRIDRGERFVSTGDYTGLVFLFDIDTTDLVSIMHDHFLSSIRVAATSAIALEYLVDESATRMGLFGTGEQAQAIIEAFQHTRNFDEIAVYSPTRANREKFVETYDDRFDATVVAEDYPKAVVEGSDVVVTATNSNEPVFDGDWLEPGTHVSTIVGGDFANERTEIDRTTIRRADQVYCNRRDQIIEDKQGNLFEMISSNELQLDSIHELAELVIGEVQPTADSSNISLMKNNTGIGLQFAVAGSLLLENAEKTETGTLLPRELFVTEKGDEEWAP